MSDLKVIVLIDLDVKVQLSEIQTVLLVIIQLCQRNSSKMDEPAREVRGFFHIFSGVPLEPFH